MLEAANAANVAKDTGYRRHSQARNAGTDLRFIFEIRMPMDAIVDPLFQFLISMSSQMMYVFTCVATSSIPPIV